MKKASVERDRSKDPEREREREQRDGWVDFVFFSHRVLLGGLGEGYDDVKLRESVRVLWSF